MFSVLTIRSFGYIRLEIYARQQALARGVGTKTGWQLGWIGGLQHSSSSFDPPSYWARYTFSRLLENIMNTGNNYVWAILRSNEAIHHVQDRHTGYPAQILTERMHETREIFPTGPVNQPKAYKQKIPKIECFLLCGLTGFQRVASDVCFCGLLPGG